MDCDLLVLCVWPQASLDSENFVWTGIIQHYRDHGGRNYCRNSCICTTNTTGPCCHCHLRMVRLLMMHAMLHSFIFMIGYMSAVGAKAILTYIRDSTNLLETLLIKRGRGIFQRSVQLASQLLVT